MTRLRLVLLDINDLDLSFELRANFRFHEETKAQL